jgi:hypothetical protein
MNDTPRLLSESLDQPPPQQRERLRAAFWILGHACPHEGGETLFEAGLEDQRIGRILTQVEPHPAAELRLPGARDRVRRHHEWPASAEDLVQHAAVGVHIGRDRPPQRLPPQLGRHVGRRSHQPSIDGHGLPAAAGKRRVLCSLRMGQIRFHLLSHVVFVRDLRQSFRAHETEVGDSGDAVGRQKDVGWFDVPVDDAFVLDPLVVGPQEIVSVVEAAGNLDRDVESLVEAGPLFLTQPIGKIAAIHVFDEETWHSANLLQIICGADIWMNPQCDPRFRLALEAGATVFGREHRRERSLDRHHSL